VTISAFDLFKVGIGPSSSHTVGPMRAAGMFAASLAGDGVVDRVAGIRAELFGSLGATGHGHGSVKAIVLGLSGELPETVDPAAAALLVAAVTETGRLRLPSGREIEFDPDEDIVLHRRKRLPFHSNAMRFEATDEHGHEVSARTYYSVGGGFVLGEDEAGTPQIVPDATPVPRGRGQGRAAGDLAGDAGVRAARLRGRGGAAGRAAGAPPGADAAREPGADQRHRRPAIRDGVGHPLRPRRQ
jgi:L-serine dehydratase